MMKKILVYSLLLTTLLAGCKKNTDLVFDQTPDQRINEMLEKYQTQLQSAQYGWNAVLVADSGRGNAYSFYFNFNDKNRVTMYSDFKDDFATQKGEASYRLKALQQVSLLFDTYSYIHVLADPDPDVADGALGSGYGIDFELYFSYASADTIRLTGRKHETLGWMFRATKAEADAYATGQMKVSKEFDNYFKNIHQYWKTMTIGGVTYQITANPKAHSISFAWREAGVAKTFSTNYYITSTGVGFVEALRNGATTISGFTGITWDAANAAINVRVNNSTYSIRGTNTPIYIDVNAPKNWWQAAVAAENTFWYTMDGFHVDGADDGYGLKSLTGSDRLPKFWYLQYWPMYETEYDLFGPVFRNDSLQRGLPLGANAIPSFTAFPVNGQLTFFNAGTYGTPPSSGPAFLTSQRLFNGTYYFVKTGVKAYDMVSVLDSRKWISWTLAN